MQQDKSKQQLAAEVYLNVPLPDDAVAVHYHFHQSGEDQSLYWIFLKFECSEDSYYQFIEQLGLETRDKQITPHLPAAWGLPGHIELEWWNPTALNPESAAAKSIDNHGWIVAKYEDKHLYLSVNGVTV